METAEVDSGSIPGSAGHVTGRSIDVLHVTGGLQRGGANMALCRLLENLQGPPGSHNVLCLTDDGPLRQRVSATGSEVELIGLQQGIVAFSALRRLAAATRQRGAGVIQGWTYHANLAASFASWSSGLRAPVVWRVGHSIRDLSHDKAMTRLVIRAGAPLSRTTAGIVYCSRASAHQHEQLGYDASKAVVIPNGFDCQIFRPSQECRAKLRYELGIPPGRLVIGHVARFHPIKDHTNLVQAAARVLGAGHDIHLVMVGRRMDQDNEQVAAIILDAGIGERVTLLGERTDVAELMPGLDVFALSSTGEAFPNVLGEAMACGVPCVATDVGDCAWIIGDSGIVLRPRDPDALAAGIMRLASLSEEDRRGLGARARQRVIDSFEISRVAQLYEALYARILEGAH